MKSIRKIVEKLDCFMVAATFAEAGDWRTARGILEEKEKRSGRRVRDFRREQARQRPVLRA